jgi:hypothetical protein
MGTLRGPQSSIPFMYCLGKKSIVLEHFATYKLVLCSSCSLGVFTPYLILERQQGF